VAGTGVCGLENGLDDREQGTRLAVETTLQYENELIEEVEAGQADSHRLCI
jgi:hypothetical protein